MLRDEELPNDAELRWAPTLCKFTFPATEAGRLLYLLDVDAASVYPGLAGVEQLLFEFTLMPRPAHRDED